MADVSHELGSLRFVVDSPLSSKVAMFNNQAQQHKQNQLLNPFSTSDGRASPKPTFSKDEYGKPLAGSLTEMRGQKANIHVMKEMLELCQIISSEGYKVNDEPNMRVIPFGELFNIYNYISDKVVGILLRARKHKLVEFEGEMLFQRRDDDVPIFLLKPIQEIRRDLESKMEELKRASSPAPQATSVLLDKSAHRQKLREAGIAVSKSPTPSPATSKASSPAPPDIIPAASIIKEEPTPTVANEIIPKEEIVENTNENSDTKSVEESGDSAIEKQTTPEAAVPEVKESIAPEQQPEECNGVQENAPTVETAVDTTVQAETQEIPTEPAIEENPKSDINNNENNEAPLPLPTIIIEASAEHVQVITVPTDQPEPPIESAQPTEAAPIEAASETLENVV